MLMDIFTFLACFALGWIIGRSVLLASLQNLIKDYADATGIDLQSKLDAKVPICIIESEGNELYLYDKNTNAFYCQAPSLNELAENLKKNKNIDLAFVIQVIGDTPKVWMFKEGKVELAKLNES